MTCNCDIGMCVNRPDCRMGNRHQVVHRNQPTDRDGNPAQHGTRDKINRLRERLRGPSADLQGVLKGVLDLLEDEL